MPNIDPGQVAAGVILAFTNGMILFGLSISPSKEAALETLVNGAAILGFLVHQAIRSHGRAKIVAAGVATGTVVLK